MEERTLREARQFLTARVGVRPNITESYLDGNKEAKIVLIVTTTIKAHHTSLWSIAKAISTSVEREYGGIWGCVVGVNPCTLSMMGGRDHISLNVGNLAIFVFKRS